MNNRALESKRLLAVLRLKSMPELKTIDEVSEFVSNFMIKRYKLDCISDINEGYCFIWAYLVWALMPEPVDFVTDDGHVVIRYKGEYYDATSFGFYELDDILNDGTPKTVDVKQMAWYWARVGSHRGKFRSIIRRTCKSVYDVVMNRGSLPDDGKGIYTDDMSTIDDIPF
jgi:hypothetical protein